MGKEKKQEKKVEKKKVSRADLIEKELKVGGTVEEIAAKVTNIKEGENPAYVKGQIKAIMKCIKEKKGRWKAFTLEEKNGKFKI